MPPAPEFTKRRVVLRDSKFEFSNPARCDPNLAAIHSDNDVFAKQTCVILIARRPCNACGDGGQRQDAPHDEHRNRAESHLITPLRLAWACTPARTPDKPRSHSPSNHTRT